MGSNKQHKPLFTFKEFLLEYVSRFSDHTWPDIISVARARRVYTRLMEGRYDDPNDHLFRPYKKIYDMLVDKHKNKGEGGYYFLIDGNTVISVNKNKKFLDGVAQDYLLRKERKSDSKVYIAKATTKLSLSFVKEDIG